VAPETGSTLLSFPSCLFLPRLFSPGPAPGCLGQSSVKSAPSFPGALDSSTVVDLCSLGSPPSFVAFPSPELFQSGTYSNIGPTLAVRVRSILPYPTPIPAIPMHLPSFLPCSRHFLRPDCDSKGFAVKRPSCLSRYGYFI